MPTAVQIRAMTIFRDHIKEKGMSVPAQIFSIEIWECWRALGESDRVQYMDDAAKSLEEEKVLGQGKRRKAEVGQPTLDRWSRTSTSQGGIEQYQPAEMPAAAAVRPRKNKGDENEAMLAVALAADAWLHAPGTQKTLQEVQMPEHISQAVERSGQEPRSAAPPGHGQGEPVPTSPAKSDRSDGYVTTEAVESEDDQERLAAVMQAQPVSSLEEQREMYETENMSPCLTQEMGQGGNLGQPSTGLEWTVPAQQMQQSNLVQQGNSGHHAAGTLTSGMGLGLPGVVPAAWPQQGLQQKSSPPPHPGLVQGAGGSGVVAAAQFQMLQPALNGMMMPTFSPDAMTGNVFQDSRMPAAQVFPPLPPSAGGLQLAMSNFSSPSHLQSGMPLMHMQVLGPAPVPQTGNAEMHGGSPLRRILRSMPDGRKMTPDDIFAVAQAHPPPPHHMYKDRGQAKVKRVGCTCKNQKECKCTGPVYKIQVWTPCFQGCIDIHPGTGSCMLGGKSPELAAQMVEAWTEPAKDEPKKTRKKTNRAAQPVQYGPLPGTRL